MSTKHTPGPWKVVAVDWSPEGNARFEIEGVHRTGIADARLIGAAPELLEALKGLYETGAPEGLALTADEIQARFDSARAAIAKATGGAA